MANRWLFKEEPSSYSYEDLERDGKAAWVGVRNNLAAKHLRQAAPGDPVLYYHTGRVRAVVGTCEVVTDPYPDPGADDPRFVAVDIEPVEALERPVTLAELKEDPAFEGSPLARIPRLSVVPITADQWKAVLRRSRD